MYCPEGHNWRECMSTFLIESKALLRFCSFYERIEYFLISSNNSDLFTLSYADFKSMKPIQSSYFVLACKFFNYFKKLYLQDSIPILFWNPYWFFKFVEFQYFNLFIKYPYMNLYVGDKAIMGLIYSADPMCGCFLFRGISRPIKHLFPA